MALIEPARQEPDHQKEIKKHSAGIRIWHWLNALIITGSLVTVLINSTLFEDHSAEARSIMETLEDKVWSVHIYFGYALAALFLFRIVQEIRQRHNQKFLYKLTHVYKDYFVERRNMEVAKHELIVKMLYIIFYMLLAIMVITGLTLAFEDQLGIPRKLAHTIKDFHGFCMYLIIAFAGLHIIGVIMAEKKDSSGIVSDMINGGKDS